MFRLTKQVTLTQGTHVDVLILHAMPTRDPAVVAAKLAQQAAWTPRSGRDESTSTNHDQILFGRKCL